MLNITKTIEYSLIAIRHINYNGNDRLCTSKEISTTYNIPKEILAKTMQKLCKKGYLNTVKGAYGGYYLNTNLENISLITFIEDIEGPVGVVKCSTDLNCDLKDICNIKSPILKINDNIRKVLSEVSLYEITE
tara:strand:- start:649 stop:1047 length:399 start_codon:yes stop_codon:yes gene_type:complete